MIPRNKLIRFYSLLAGVLLLLGPTLSWGQTNGGSWQKIREAKTGTLVVHYLVNEPFIFKENEVLQGIEYELLQGFVKYVAKIYQVNLKLDFKAATSLSGLYTLIKNSPVDQSVLGISSFSITPKRLPEVGFTPPYCPDIEVLISNAAVPGIKNQADFKNFLGDGTALYMRNSSFEENLTEVKKIIPKVKTLAVANSDDVLQRISAEIDKFGYIELPKYLLGLKKGLKVKRQNLLKVTREGYSMLFPKDSDWRTPLNAFFTSVDFQQQLSPLLEKYLGKDIQELLIKAKTQVSQKSDRDIFEVEQQLKTMELQKKDLELKRDQLYIRIFIIGFVLAAIILLLLFRNNLQKQRTNQLLQKQKEEIELQKDVLSEKNEQILQQKEEISQQRDHVIAKNVEIENRKNELNTLNQVKDRIFSIVSHDLRSPLNSLKGTLELMEMGALDEKEINYFSSELNKELAYVLELLENLLKWAKAQMEGIEPSPEQIDVYELARKNVGLLKPIAIKKGIVLINEVPEGTTAWGDEEMIKLVIRNLISNAIKFTKEEGQIKVQYKPANEEIELAIVDNGVGISPEKQAQLFNSDTHFTTQGTNREKGTGLGLLICKEFVEKNDGRIWVESEPKKGSAFRFTLKTINH